MKTSRLEEIRSTLRCLHETYNQPIPEDELNHETTEIQFWEEHDSQNMSMSPPKDRIRVYEDMLAFKYYLKHPHVESGVERTRVLNLKGGYMYAVGTARWTKRGCGKWYYSKGWDDFHRRFYKHG